MGEQNFIRPLLTVVATTRNDDHGGNLVNRMQLFVNGLLEQCRRHQLDAELVLVEWNPPEDKPRLSEALTWPVKDGPCTVRIIEVSPEVHQRFSQRDQLPLFQMLAKNVGIRRARGRFILATNIDILFSDEIIRFFASGKMKPSRMYRVDRFDVPANVPGDLSLDQQLEFCRNNVIRRHARRRTPDLAYNGDRVFVTDRLSWEWRDWRGWPLTIEVRGLVGGGRSYLRNRWPEYKVQLEALQDRLFPNSLPRHFTFQLPMNLHTNASGDFTMLDAAHWNTLRGYPEFLGSCMHLDALLCYMAHHSGAREQVLTDPMRIYHIDHGGGGEAAEGDGAALYYRLDAGGVSRLKTEEIYDWAIEMRRKGEPIIFNSENWGLAGDDLPETVISPAGK